MEVSEGRLLLGGGTNGMGQVIEADEQGLLRVPVEMLGAVQPHSRYVVEVVGKKLSIEPEEAAENV